MNEELKPKTKKQNSGFTLIEIMVATAIFMIIMLAAIGALFVASNSAQKAKALRAAMDNGLVPTTIARRLLSTFLLPKPAIKIVMAVAGRPLVGRL